MAGTTALIFFDFAYFREQTCLVACPYGRLQSVLLDRQSLIVGYDSAPRRAARTHGVEGPARPPPGDCIDCGACVAHLPDRDRHPRRPADGVHPLHPVHRRLRRRHGQDREAARPRSATPRRDEVEGKPPGWIRPRVVLYPAALVLAVGLLVFNLGTRADTDVTVLRGVGAPFTREPDGIIVNQVRIKITNRDADPRDYRLELTGVEGASLIAPQNPVTVPGSRTIETGVFVVVPEDGFEDDRLPSVIRITDGAGFGRSELPFDLVGPEREHHDDGDAR